MTTLNGWQRLWILLGLVWFGLVLGLSILLWPGRQDGVDLDVATTMPVTARQQEAILVTLLVWLIPVVTTYAIGFGVAWVRRGFPRRQMR